MREGILINHRLWLWPLIQLILIRVAHDLNHKEELTGYGSLAGKHGLARLFGSIFLKRNIWRKVGNFSFNGGIIAVDPSSLVDRSSHFFKERFVKGNYVASTRYSVTKRY